MKESKKELLSRIFKLDNKLLIVILLDLLFFIFLAASIYLLNFILIKNYSMLENTYPTLEKINKYIYQSQSPEDIGKFQNELEETRNILIKIIINTVFIVIGFYIIFILILSLLKGMVWTKITVQKFSFKFFVKFLFLNYIWITFWVFVIVGSFFIFKEPIKYYFVIPEIILYIYFTSIIRALFDEKEGIFKNIKNGIIFSFKLNKLSLPILLIILSFLIISLISYLIYLIIKGAPLVIILLALIVFYSVFLRRYLFLVKASSV